MSYLAPDFPGKITFTMGSAFAGVAPAANPIDAGEVIVTRLVELGVYTEDGTTDANDSTNRLKVEFSADFQNSYANYLWGNKTARVYASNGNQWVQLGSWYQSAFGTTGNPPLFHFKDIFSASWAMGYPSATTVGFFYSSLSPWSISYNDGIFAAMENGCNGAWLVWDYADSPDLLLDTAVNPNGSYVTCKIHNVGTATAYVGLNENQYEIVDGYTNEITVGSYIEVKRLYNPNGFADGQHKMMLVCDSPQVDPDNRSEQPYTSGVSSVWTFITTWKNTIASHRDRASISKTWTVTSITDNEDGDLRAMFQGDDTTHITAVVRYPKDDPAFTSNVLPHALWGWHYKDGAASRYVNFMAPDMRFISRDGITYTPNNCPVDITDGEYHFIDVGVRPSTSPNGEYLSVEVDGVNLFYPGLSSRTDPIWEFDSYNFTLNEQINSTLIPGLCCTGGGGGSNTGYDNVTSWDWQYLIISNTGGYYDYAKYFGVATFEALFNNPPFTNTVMFKPGLSYSPTINDLGGGITWNSPWGSSPIDGGLVGLNAAVIQSSPSGGTDYAPPGEENVPSIVPKDIFNSRIIFTYAWQSHIVEEGVLLQ